MNKRYTTTNKNLNEYIDEFKIVSANTNRESWYKVRILFCFK